MAIQPSPTQKHVEGGEYLGRFDPLYAPLVASWVRTPQELEWLAPATPPPLTAAKVAAWGKERSNRLLLFTGAGDLPIAYAELNPMLGLSEQMWIGHFLLDPSARGRAWGVRFAQALLAEAFVNQSARDVFLVVFPENERAIRCYERAGFVALGEEKKHFPATGREHLFLRMGVRKSRFAKLAAAGKVNAEPLLIRRP